MDKLATAERYSWYIINALMYKCSTLEKAIEDGKRDLVHDDGNAIYESLKGMLEHCEQSLKEHKVALEALKKAGFE